MPNWTLKLILLAPLVMQVSCADVSLRPSPAPQKAEVCWPEPTIMLEGSDEWLAANDPEFLKRVIGNHKLGQAKGCWR